LLYLVQEPIYNIIFLTIIKYLIDYYGTYQKLLRCYGTVSEELTAKSIVLAVVFFPNEEKIDNEVWYHIIV
jgi:hypothetical protein